LHQLLSHEPGKVANRVLIASRLPLERDSLSLPDFDHQFRANMVVARLPEVGLRILGLRVPAYKSQQRAQLLRAWQWLENAAVGLRESPAVILGDLNIRPTCGRTGVGAYFHRILESGWQRAAPTDGYSFLGLSGRRSDIDHVLVTAHCNTRCAKYVPSVSDFTLAGASGALSDHAALVVDLDIRNTQ
jgi:endonuclease/exonuclease/phosphatase family metal-dependent hydrolase